MHACVRLLRTGFEQIVKLLVAPEQLLNRKHGRSVVLDPIDSCNARTAVRVHQVERLVPKPLRIARAIPLGTTRSTVRPWDKTRCTNAAENPRCPQLRRRLHKHFSQGSLNELIKGNIMATKNKSTESVYRVTEVIGTSTQSWEDAAKAAVQTAAGTLRDLRIAEVVKMDVKIEDGKVLEFRTRLQLSFKYEG